MSKDQTKSGQVDKVALQGELCVSAYRYLRSLDMNVNTKDNSAARLKEFNTAYKNYKTFIGENNFVSMVKGNAEDKAREIIDKCADAGFHLSCFWERDPGDLNISLGDKDTNIGVRYGTFRKIDCTEDGEATVEFTVRAIIDEKERDILIANLCGNAMTLSFLDGTPITVDVLEDYEHVTMKVNDKSVEFNLALLGIHDPFDMENIYYNIDEDTFSIVQCTVNDGDISNLETMVTTYTKEDAVRLYGLVPGYQRDERNEYMSNALIMLSLYDGMTEEEFSDFIKKDDYSFDIEEDIYPIMKGYTRCKLFSMSDRTKAAEMLEKSCNELSEFRSKFQGYAYTFVYGDNTQENEEMYYGSLDEDYSGISHDIIGEWLTHEEMEEYRRYTGAVAEEEMSYYIALASFRFILAKKSEVLAWASEYKNFAKTLGNESVTNYLKTGKVDSKYRDERREHYLNSDES